MAFARSSGLGGQPGTLMSIGISEPAPGKTEYESQYGPPVIEQTPNAITTLGSIKVSYAAKTFGANAFVTVPATTKILDWPFFEIIAPADSTISTAAASTPQQARPAWRKLTVFEAT